MILPILSLIAAAAPWFVSPQSAPSERTRLARLSDLPPRWYAVAGDVTALLNSEREFAQFAEAFERDLQADLLAYEFEDPAARRQLFYTLARLALLRGDDEPALRWNDQARATETRRADRETSGIVLDSYVRARRATGDDAAALPAKFREEFAAAVAALPWEVVSGLVEQTRLQLTRLTPELLLGTVGSQIDPVVRETGKIDSYLARQVVAMRVLLRIQLPLKAQIVEVLSEASERQRRERADIWSEREITIESGSPLVVGIWGSGVDPEALPGRMFVNAAEQPNGRDDDGNAYIDDIHGIAFGFDAQREVEPLLPLGEDRERLMDLLDLTEGRLDEQAGIESQPAVRLRTLMAGLEPHESEALLDDLAMCAEHAFGTHSAGLAVTGNPAARVLSVRQSFDPRATRSAPSVEYAYRLSKSLREAVEYFRASEVRVVSLTWSLSAAAVERALEEHAVGADAAERSRLAGEIFAIQSAGLAGAIESAPAILFIASVGAGQDEGEIPASIDLPNLMLVGAVDQAGRPGRFTSAAARVAAFASGVEVDGVVAGGRRMKLSGAALAAPQVANLAAKLLALDPALAPTDVIAWIRRGATPSSHTPPVLLIHPKRTIEMLREAGEKG